MKKATCRELKGACDEVIKGRDPEDMAKQSREHVMDMIQKGDDDHMAAADEMQSMSEEDQKAWYEKFVEGFEGMENA